MFLLILTEKMILCPVMNGLPDQDAQLITLKKISLKPSTKHFKVIRTFDENLLNDFLNKLSYEMWDTTFSSQDIKQCLMHSWIHI